MDKIAGLFLLIIFCSNASLSQIAQDTESPEIIKASYSTDLAEPVTNCAVESIFMNGEEIIYVFGGLDSTLKFSGIHRRVYKVIPDRGIVERVADIPDSLGRIGMAASRIGDKIYLAGGYHVFSNGTEKSSAWVHEFDPAGDTFTSKQIVIPVPTDDHIQFYYASSQGDFLYLVGGWSENRNIRDVQIYDVNRDVWHQGTTLPDDRYEFFGASANFEGNQLTYAGGASDVGAFETRSYVRRGTIGADFKSITWRIDSTNGVNLGVYRALSLGEIYLGGTDSSYNYNGVHYASRRVVSPTRRALVAASDTHLIRCDEPNQDSCISSFYPSPNSLDLYQVKWPLDIRDWGKTRFETPGFGPVYHYWIAGGILEGQRVSNKLIRVEKGFFTSQEEFNKTSQFKLFPNPAGERIYIQHHYNRTVEAKILDLNGKQIESLTIPTEGISIDLSDFEAGMYFLLSLDGGISSRLIKK